MNRYTYIYGLFITLFVSSATAQTTRYISLDGDNCSDGNHRVITNDFTDATKLTEATLLNGKKTAGRPTVHFDVKNLVPGMYIYRMQAGNNTLTKKMTLI